jgi:hypothetical protein
LAECNPLQEATIAGHLHERNGGGVRPFVGPEIRFVDPNGFALCGFAKFTNDKSDPLRGPTAE